MKPTKAPTLGPSTIAPISVGTCRVVTLRGPKGIIPYPDTPNAIVIPANKPIMVSSRIVIPLFFSFLTFLRSTGLVVSLSWIDTVELSSIGRSLLFIDPPSFSFLTDISRN